MLCQCAQKIAAGIIPDGIDGVLGTFAGQLLCFIRSIEGQNRFLSVLLVAADGFTLKKVGGVWKYYVGNTFVPITTVASFSGSRYYVEDGGILVGFEKV